MLSLRILLLGFAVLMAATCAESPTGPQGVSGRYRLVSVNGYPLPFAGVNAQGFSAYISGDLNLRPNSTYGFGLQSSPIAFYDEGVWGLASGMLELVSAFSEFTHELELFGDSVVARYPSAHLTLTFKRSAATGAALQGAYAMTALMGNPDRRYEWLKWEDIGPEYIEIPHDTIRFIDDVFFWRSRSFASGRVGGGGATFEYRQYGAYDLQHGNLELRHFGNTHTFGNSDFLSVTPNHLERVRIRRDLAPDHLEWRETYSRVE